MKALDVISMHVTAAFPGWAPPSPWENFQTGRSSATKEERLQRMVVGEPPRKVNTDTTFRTLLYTKVGKIAIISQNRTHVLNARNLQMYFDLIAAFEEAELDPEVHAVVFTGEGRYFCSGADTTGGKKKCPLDDLPDPPRVQELKSVKWFVGTENDEMADSSTWPAVRHINTFVNFPKLLVAAVNGPAVGEGFTSLLHADIIFSVETATFWTPFFRFAAVPEFCSSVLLKQRVGMNVANEMILMSKKKTAQELKLAGLVNEILPAGETFMPAVLQRVNEAMELAGEPSTRDQSIRLFKGMMKPQAERENLMVLNQREQELSFGWHGRAAVRNKNLKYYSETMPTAGGGRRRAENRAEDKSKSAALS